MPVCVRSWLFGAALMAAFACVAAAADPPAAPVVPDELPPGIEVLQPGVKLTLLAEHPQLVTPTGIDVDAEGNLWVAACHTHFRPQGYSGPEHDEILVFDKDGGKRRVFYNRTTATMNLKLGPDGWLYLAERSRILRVCDTNGDGLGDTEETLATLETEADYPHNGLSGMAWHPDGDLVFALGENFSKHWTLTGTDGVRLTGSGEGGVFRCSAGGAGLRRIARGFWNPFGLLARADGEMFAAENDPGSRPPCRLLHLVEGADYGYHRGYGSAPVHPFVAWNGELRGTLGMVHRVSEAPCAIVELGGGVLLPSWSEHCIDFFPLRRNGASFTTERVELLRGSDFFRPVGMAPGPDGAFYLSDWVFSSYPIHGRGRLWRLDIDRSQAPWMQATAEPPNESVNLARALRQGSSDLETSELFALARRSTEDPILADAALAALAHRSRDWTPQTLRALPTTERLWALVALRRIDLQDAQWVRALWDDPDPEVRFECLRWIADGMLTDFKPQVSALLAQSDLDFRLFEAALAAWNTLNGQAEAGVTDPALLLERLADENAPSRLRGYALRLLPPKHARLSLDFLEELLRLDDASLTQEVVRTLAANESSEAHTLLATLAANPELPASARLDAVAGLAASDAPEHRTLLLERAEASDTELRNEALRALRLGSLSAETRSRLEQIARDHPDTNTLVQAALDSPSLAKDRPPFEATADWQRRLAALPGQADPEAGRRLFFHSRLARCASCHRHSGRGVVVGPDLTLIGDQGDETALLQSILEPSREVAPQFFPTLLTLKDGGSFTGFLLRSSSNEVYRELNGAERRFEKSDILTRTEMRGSVMPVGLVHTLTDAELRDLLAFLLQSRPG